MTRWCLHVDSADEMAQWNQALTYLITALARREAKAIRDGRAVDDKPYKLITDIDRYLSKHGFLTEKQLNVLIDIAKQNQVTLPQIPQKG